MESVTQFQFSIKNSCQLISVITNKLLIFCNYYGITQLTEHTAIVKATCTWRILFLNSNYCLNFETMRHAHFLIPAIIDDKQKLFPEKKNYLRSQIKCTNINIIIKAIVNTSITEQGTLKKNKK
jgi:hypothetical protein